MCYFVVNLLLYYLSETHCSEIRNYIKYEKYTQKGKDEKQEN